MKVPVRWVFTAAAIFSAAVLWRITDSSGAATSDVTQVSAAAVAAPPAANPAREAQCREILRSAPRGAVRSYQLHGDFGTVIVGPVYYTAPFDAKQALDGTLRCILADGRADDAGVSYIEYLDMYSNKEVAKWSKYTGFSMD